MRESLRAELCLRRNISKRLGILTSRISPGCGASASLIATVAVLHIKITREKGIVENQGGGNNMVFTPASAEIVDISAPDKVPVGESYRLEVTLKSTGDAIADPIVVVTGPDGVQRENMTMGPGHRETVTFTRSMSGEAQTLKISGKNDLWMSEPKTVVVRSAGQTSGEVSSNAQGSSEQDSPDQPSPNQNTISTMQKAAIVAAVIIFAVIR